jgi:hypothetical protein
MPKTWNSLEIVKLLVSATTPVVLALIAYWATQQQWTNQTLTQKRIEVYDKAAPMMDNVVSYFFCVGKWKDVTPKQILDEKRDLDALLYINGALFSPELKDSWDGFRTAAFQELNGIGSDALLRTKASYHSMAKPWNADWDKAFTNENNQPDIRKTYKTLMS